MAVARTSVMKCVRRDPRVWTKVPGLIEDEKCQA